MPPVSAVLDRCIARPLIRVHPALWNFVEECGGVIVRITAYVGVLALIASVAARVWIGFPVALPLQPSAKEEWRVADRLAPAFALSQLDSSAKIETYEIYRHSQGGRRDVLRWAALPDDGPIAQLELYRPGTEPDQASADSGGKREIAGEGVVGSKFGSVALFGYADGGAKRCLGFMKNIESANLRISGWSCQGDSLPARRLAIACTLNRLTLLTAGNDPKLAELFAHAELKRGNGASGCGHGPLSADWVTGAQNPRLRGSF